VALRSIICAVITFFDTDSDTDSDCDFPELASRIGMSDLKKHGKHMNGFVTDIVRGSFHDGPGIRTVVFLQGCSLRCSWCHNPETWSTEPQPMYYPDSCAGCGLCGGLKENTDECRYGARVYSSRAESVEEVMNAITMDRPFFRHGGGVTFSGGEPCCQMEFLIELLKRCRDEKISTAIETNLNYPVDVLKGVLPHLDLLMADLKIMDSQIHQHYTGFSNERILENIEFLQNCDTPVIIRTPLLAGVSDTDSNIEQIVVALKKIDTLEYYEFLRYHPLGMRKYQGLDHDCPEFEAPSDERLKVICGKVKSAGIRLFLDGKEVGYSESAYS